jgi:glucose-6-phosphate dehydrogenase assembly protein OpcA
VTDPERELLPDGVEMPFSEIAAALAHGDSRVERTTVPRALTATIVAVGPDDSLVDAADALRQLARTAAVRTILISEGQNARPHARLMEDIVAIPGLKAQFVDNAVAALRLSSLPTLVWWRGGSAPMLEALTHLADRVVLDDGDPVATWKQAVRLLDHSAFSDLRWTRLTRWRALMAHFFDVPEVRAAAPRFETLAVVGADRAAASLFSGWLGGALGRGRGLRLEFTDGTRGVFVERIALANSNEELAIELGRSGACVQTSADVTGHSAVVRMVSLGNQTAAALLAEELRIRARDMAFEQALHAAVA